MNENDWKMYHRGKYHAYSIILDMIDMGDDYAKMKKTVEKLVNRYQNEEKNFEKTSNADVAPVIRCGDCQSYYSGVCTRFNDVTIANDVVTENDFCSRATKRAETESEGE